MHIELENQRGFGWLKPLASVRLWLVPGILSIIALGISYSNYLAFHTFVEFAAIIISFVMFSLAWNTYDFSKNNFFLFLACGYFWVGSLDLMHTLTYKDMGTLPNDNGHRALQFWVGTRYYEALLLVAAPLIAARVHNKHVLFSIFGLFAVALGLFVFSGNFPAMFVDGQGLTDAKIYSEYAINLILLGALVAIVRSRPLLSLQQRVIISASIVMTIGTELVFTFYIDLYGLSNILGHVFKLFSFWLIYSVILQESLIKPYLEVHKLSQAVEQSPAIVVITDPGGRIQYTNKKFEQTTGYTNEEVLGKRPSILKSGETSDAEYKALWQTISSGKEWWGEFHNKRKDGSLYWEQAHISSIKDPNGNIINYLAIKEDVSEQIERNQALAESEQRFRDFAESTSDWFWEQDENLKFVKVVAHVGMDEETTFDRSRLTESIGYTRWEFADVNPDEDENWRQHVDDLEARRSFRDFRYRASVPGGEEHILNINGVPIFDPDGTFRGYRGTASDATDLVQTQDKNERFVHAFSQLPEGIALWDADERFVLANECYRRLVRSAVDQLVPGITYLEWLRICADKGTAPEAAGGVEAWLAERADNLKVQASPIEVLRDGRWQQLRFEKLPDGSNMQINLDIHELKLSEEKLRRAQKLEVVGQLTGGVAHDFNNLLGVMIGNAEILSDRVGEDQVARSNLSAIIRAAERGASLTQRLLAFSRQQTLSSQPTSINELVLGLEEMLQRTLGETIELNIRLGSEVKVALIDPHQFEDALVNLSLNARHAMTSGGVLEIETANTSLDQSYTKHHEQMKPGDYVKVTVSDTGSGMTPEVREKAFEPFFTTKEVGEGSGLGLSMVYGFVSQSKGAVEITSELGHGTVVELYLPRSDQAPGKAATKDGASEFVYSSDSILVVEDDADIREISTGILRHQGYQVIEADCGKNAIELLSNGQPVDLLFTDMVLPGGMNGLEIAEQARQLQPDIKVLFTSGYAENSVIHGGELDPGITLVSKPYRRVDLLDTVREMLDSSQD